ncbi:hypothetical protein PQO01_15585 [Lentisphaera marina]|uniref:tetratricopeptide repeat protein n=1 Tax=Lentisphaera marina TaxID=1111041 RepID=UPI0023673C37|nr:tetratricopeptide repeat protein [Lentisphaera marina]MDD7986371.1 hypothetical protein [Lentisphaera marina]
MKKLFCVLVLVAFQLYACVNSTYSRLDEKRITNDLAYIVMGQFAHRSPEFYRFQAKEAISILLNDDSNFFARNDLAVAYIKLGNYRKAEDELKKNEELHPGKYETAANFGVLYKKKQDFAKAAEYIEKSLEIKSEGHMGLGDYYLKMCKSLASDDPTVNFLGVAYDAKAQENAEIANKEYLISLIKNDYMFADAYLILGDVLYLEGDYQLAALAYGRAYNLEGSMNIHSKVKLLREQWLKHKQSGEVVEDRHKLYRSIGRPSQQAQVWVEEFKRVDAELIERTGEAKSIDSVLQEMEKQEVYRELPLTVGIYKGYRLDAGAIFFGAWITVIVIIILLIIRQRIKKKSKAQKSLNEQELN